MFTGIIEEIGYVDRIDKGSQSAKLRIRAHKVLDGTSIGDSIAVSGVCLTVTSMGSDYFTADVMEETVRRSSLASLSIGDGVNLERAMLAGGRFGGHIVAGHVDTIAKIISIEKGEMAKVYRMDIDDINSLRYIVEKGSIAIDGISLTVASVDDRGFSVSIIPHTIAETTLADRGVSDIVNIETDLVGKYIEKLLSGDISKAMSVGEAKGVLSGDFDKASEFLAEHGFDI